MTSEAPPLPVESVQDYPRPPALEPVAQRLQIWLGTSLVADTTAGYRVLETHHAPTYYFPPEDLHADLTPAGGAASFCEWKGRAAYWTVTAGGRSAANAAWSYPAPSERFRKITGYVAFYASLMSRCTVGGIEVTPQPGDFYGGWVTPNLQGQIKGAPGTRHW